MKNKISNATTVLIITGVPGTGKTTLAKLLFKRLKNVYLVGANEIAKRNKLYLGFDKADNAHIVDLKKLEKEVNVIIKREKQSGTKYIIFEGHLLCDIKIPNVKVIVLRSHINTLEKRLKKRGYSNKKLSENIMSELINYCGNNSRKNYNNVYEVLNDKNCLKTSLKIINNIKVKRKTYDILSEFNEKHKKYLT
ncbi:MAG: AAA family ATPase [Candidatus Micrarchaeia archaeon]